MKKYFLKVHLGGGFTALAEYVLKNGGVVYGAGYDDSMRVICKKATSNDELKEMRGSKFVQSLLGNTYKDVKDELNTGKRVMYSGTPCQVEGLLCYLKEKPDNLLCVDFVCRGVPSPGLWENYVQFMERKFGSKMVGARFKHKTYGYHTTTMKIDFANGKTYYGSGRVDPYMKAFVSELASRPSCVTCKFKGLERPSDITIFDCFEYSQITGKKDDDKGYSSVYVHSDKGEKILQAIISGFDAIQEVNTEKLIECNGIMVRNSAKAHEKRDEFYKLAAALSIDKAINCVAPITYQDFVIERAKSFLYDTGTIKYIRKLKKKHTIATTKKTFADLKKGETVISIVIPVYNVEKYLVDCLDSIISQNFSDWEVIMVNDGSTDHSDEIGKEYCEKDKRFRIYEQSNRGVSAARNKGIELCQGEYVFFMDADDTILHNTLSDLNDVISRTEADIVSFQNQKIQNLKDVVEQALPHEYEVLSREQAMRLFLQERLIGISMCTKLVKRSAIENIKFEVGRASNEDKDF